MFQAKQPRFGVAVLTADRYCAYFDKAKSKEVPVGEVLGVLIEASREADGIEEGVAEEGLFEAAVAYPVGAAEALAQERRSGGDAECPGAEVMGLFGV